MGMLRQRQKWAKLRMADDFQPNSLLNQARGNISCTQSWMESQQHQYQSRMSFISSYFSRTGNKKEEKDQEAVLDAERKAIDTYFHRLAASLLKLPQSQDNSLQRHIRDIVFENFSKEEESTIKQQLQKWREFPIADLVADDYDQKVIEIYAKCPVLSARVLHRLSELMDSSRYSKPNQNCNFQLKKQFGQFLRKEEVSLSYTRYCFEKHRRFRYHEDDQIGNQVNQAQFAQKVRNWADQNRQKDQTISKLLEFLQAIGLLVFQNNQETPNVFIRMFERIKKQDQRKMFLLNYQHPFLEQMLLNPKQNYAKMYANYNFYKDHERISRSDLNITQLHWQNYNYGYLQGSHDYIQWMFPNHYGSAFNARARPLDYIESQLFMRDLEIGVRILKSIYIFLDFMGLRFNPITLDIVVCSEKRFADVIMVNYHNHLRIMRILACLSVTGFRKVALRLIEILDQYTQKGKPFAKERREFEKSWSIYGEGTLQKAKAMCFLETEDFPGDHEIIKIAADLQITIELEKKEKQGQTKTEQPSVNEKKQPQLIEVEDFDAPTGKSHPQNEQQIGPKQIEQTHPEQVNQSEAPPIEPANPNTEIEEEMPDSNTSALPAATSNGEQGMMQQEKAVSPREQDPAYIVPPSGSDCL